MKEALENCVEPVHADAEREVRGDLVRIEIGAPRLGQHGEVGHVPDPLGVVAVRANRPAERPATRGDVSGPACYGRDLSQEELDG